MGRSTHALLIALLAFVASLGAATALAQEPAAPAAEAAGKDDGKGTGDGGGAPADPKAGDDAAKSTVKLRLKGLRGGDVKVGERIKALGTLRPYAKDERVSVILYRGKKAVDRRNLGVDPNKKRSAGEFVYAEKLVQPGRYSVQVVHNPSEALKGSKTRSKEFGIDYPDVDPGQKNRYVRLFNNLLAKQGYVTGTGESYNGPTQRAVLAFHKTNNMARTTNATAADFEKLAAGNGGYDVRYPNEGRHVEADISRQIMVLVDGDRAEEIYHVSTGAPATPTIPGRFAFYRYEPGFNNKGMYYSVYYQGGYATHGYPSVPTYPASHGCLRNPIPNSVHIYNWIDIGMPIIIDR